MANLMALIARDCERLERLAVLGNANIASGNHYPAGQLLAEGTRRFSAISEEELLSTYRTACESAVEDCVRAATRPARVVFAISQRMEDVWGAYIWWRLYELATAAESKIESEG